MKKREHLIMHLRMNGPDVEVCAVTVTTGDYTKVGHEVAKVYLSSIDIMQKISLHMVNVLCNGDRENVKKLRTKDFGTSEGNVYVAIHTGYGVAYSVRTSEKQWLRQMYGDNYFRQGILYVVKYDNGVLTDIGDEFTGHEFDR